MKKIFILLLVIISSIVVFAQNDSLQNEILNYSKSKTVIISNGRALLIDNLLEGDIKKAEEIKDYLVNEVKDQSYEVFSSREYWLITYWTQDYNDLINSIDDHISRSEICLRGGYPRGDLMYEKLILKSQQSKGLLETFIKDSNISYEEKDLLLMHLNYLLFEIDYPSISRDSLNLMADSFILKYSNSKYICFIRDQIRYKVLPSKWSFAAGLYCGYGGFTQDLKQNYMCNLSGGFDFDIYYKNFALYLHAYMGVGSTRRDIAYDNGIWEKRADFSVTYPEASLGYVTVDNKILKIAPFVGIATTIIGPTEDALTIVPDLEKVKLNYTPTYTIGINIDFKTGDYRTENSFWFFRLRYAYNTYQFSNKYVGMNGNMHCLTIGVGGFGRNTKRDY